VITNLHQCVLRWITEKHTLYHFTWLFTKSV